MTGTTRRDLWEIAREIRADWKRPYFGAVPYLDSMDGLRGINQRFGQEDGYSVVRYFLVNAATWRGETARRVKAELRAMLEAATLSDTERADLNGLDPRHAVRRNAYLAGDASRYEAEMIEEACWRVYDYEKNAYLGLVRDLDEYYEVTDFGCADYVAYALNRGHERQLLGKGKG